MMKSFCVDIDGVPCPVKGKGALNCSSYKDCKYIENRKQHIDEALLNLEEKIQDNEEKVMLQRFYDLSDIDKKKEIIFYKKIISLLDNI